MPARLTGRGLSLAGFESRSGREFFSARLDCGHTMRLTFLKGIEGLPLSCVIIIIFLVPPGSKDPGG